MEWEQKVLKATSEVLRHPMGGKVEIYIYADPRLPGKLRMKIEPRLNGRAKSDAEIDIAD